MNLYVYTMQRDPASLPTIEAVATDFSRESADSKVSESNENVARMLVDEAEASKCSFNIVEFTNIDVCQMHISSGQTVPVG